MNREEFLARIRTAARAGAPYRVHSGEPGNDRVGLGPESPDPIERFAAEVRAVGGEATVVDDWPQAAAALTELLDRYAPRAVLAWQHPALDRVGHAALLAARGATLVDCAALAAQQPAAQRDAALACELGLTGVRWAVAETGSLVVAAGPGTERVASLLPPVHVAIVGGDQVLPDLYDLFDRAAAEGLDRLPSSLVLITGPSKTGDVELRLTTGVHGPGKWHVLVVRAPLGGAPASE